MWAQYPPTPPFYRGENEIQASLISSASVGATPTPATTACAGPPWEVIQLPDCKSGVAKQSRKRRTGALPAFPTISGLVAQLAERPVVCGRVEGATPFGSAIFSECSSVFRAPGLGPGGRRWKSCHSDQFQIAVVVEYMRHPSSKRNDAGAPLFPDAHKSVCAIA